ncbi:MAG: hypothetical protein LBT40_11440 [Deltaproteobacteria bacterium]|nr:hypothetical protein [Deltaproteobacteria bacterium]
MPARGVPSRPASAGNGTQVLRALGKFGRWTLHNLGGIMAFIILISILTSIFG